VSARTLFEKVWDAHLVRPETPEAPAILYADLHLVHEVTSPQAFDVLREQGLRVRRPDKTVATMDHSIPTEPGGRRFAIVDPQAAEQLRRLEENCATYGIELHGMGDAAQGIVHVIGPEMGLTQPGRTIVCGDSHTSTHGAFGALAFGIGTSEVAHVLATQCVLQRRPRTLEVRVDGRLRPGVTAKDLILAVIARVGVGGGAGHVIEYTGSAVRALSMEERMTVCNMSIEAGARAGMIAPDDTTFEYLAKTPRAPKGAEWDRAVTRWRGLPSDPGASYDRAVSVDGASLEPMITYGTNPGMALPVGGRVPDPAAVTDAAVRDSLEKALRYMDLRPGQPLIGQKVDVYVMDVDDQEGNLILSKKRADFEKAWDRVIEAHQEGSRHGKQASEAEGLDRVFTDAGAEWREPGCSMCIAMNGDQLQPGQYAVSTSNRNFEGRQGKGGRTFLASPLTAAAAAVAGRIADPRELGR